MPVVVLDNCAFILPDDMDAFLKRYGADVVYLDGDDGSVSVLGPNDKEWRDLPEEKSEGASIVRIRKDT